MAWHCLHDHVIKMNDSSRWAETCGFRSGLADRRRLPVQDSRTVLGEQLQRLSSCNRYSGGICVQQLGKRIQAAPPRKGCLGFVLLIRCIY